MFCTVYQTQFSMKNEKKVDEINNSNAKDGIT